MYWWQPVHWYRTKHFRPQHTRILRNWQPKRNSWIQTHTHIRLLGIHSPNHSSLDITTLSCVWGLTIHNNKQTTIGPQPNIQTLDQKLNWLKRSVGLLLPNHPNCDELETTADLLVRYADIIGTENGIKGTFIRAVCISTNSQSRSQKQHPVAQALEADINAEIKRMATEGITESCTNPRGFNSPVFSVHKKNRSVRVVANFKRTLNKVLVDLDPYPMAQIDHLFNRIGEGNKYFASLDLRSGYWQIEIDERDRHKTAFTWRDQCYLYTRLAFGLTSAGQIFSRCIAEALATVASCDNICPTVTTTWFKLRHSINTYSLVAEPISASAPQIDLGV